MKIKDKIHRAMQQQGISGHELARRTGLPQPTISRYLSGQNDMVGEKLGRILKVLNLKVVANPPKRG